MTQSGSYVFTHVNILTKKLEMRSHVLIWELMMQTKKYNQMNMKTLIKQD